MTGEEFRRLRNALNKTQVGLAELMGTTSTTVARWERNEMSISEPIARYIRLLVQTERGRSKGRKKGGR